MSASNYDVVVVGAGAAGLAAAIGLARAGFAVAVVEAAAFPGAENWSGCVYFCESLADPAILGPQGVEALAWERRLIERGFFATDGHGLLGMKYRDPQAFRHCYTVLRPICDHHLAQAAVRHGAALLTSTTAESLIREGGRVVGVCTSRGPVYADLVFLAEGDASHLVTREGYERSADPREAPKFLQGIKEVLELPPGAIEQRFGVGAEEGAAYEILVRNGTLRGKPVRLNMGGFIYTNRRSLSVGLVLPADNLHEHFAGDPNLLIEWFESLPALRPWLEGARRGAFGAKLIRGGGAKDIPTLIDEGLAIGGGASAIGIDFPYPNFTGPATAMGLLLTRAAVAIRAEGGRFTRAALEQHYLEPLRRSTCWRDVEFLRQWPGYVKKTRTFFGRNLDVALGSAYLWTRPGRGLVGRWSNWLRLVRGVAGPDWAELREDARDLGRTLHLNEVAVVPSVGQLLLDGSLNALRDVLRQPRAEVPASGTVALHYTVAGGAEQAGLPPATLRRWFARFAPVLAAAARRVYANDGVPLDTKLPDAFRLLARQINLLDLLRLGWLGFAAGFTGALGAGWRRLRRLLRGRTPAVQPAGEPEPYGDYAEAARRTADLTPLVGIAAQEWEGRLARLGYETVKASHIHVLWPQDLPAKDTVTRAGLWHVCPAHVYEARVSPGGQVQVVVNFENCIKCETCWRTSDLVDWGRDGRHRFVYAVHSPVVTRLLADQDAVGLVRPAAPRTVDPWQGEQRLLGAALERAALPTLNGRHEPEGIEFDYLLTRLDRKLIEFGEALGEEPRHIDHGRAEYLQLLARYAQNLLARATELLRGGFPLATPVRQRLLDLAHAAASKAEQQVRHTLAQRYSWAAADGRHLRQHHLAGMRRCLDLLGPAPAVGQVPPEPAAVWLRAEDETAALAERLADWRRRLDEVFPPNVWRDLERQAPLTGAQNALLLDLLGQIPAIDADALAHTLHPPGRKMLLAELGRRDPSLAYRAACHLWARDAIALTGTSKPLEPGSWHSFAILSGRAEGAEALFVPARNGEQLVLLRGDELAVLAGTGSGLTVEPLATLGLRGAGLTRVLLAEKAAAPPWQRIDGERVRALWNALSSADLVSIASGMADLLCRRAIEHATTRVQFPGLFQDEEARDAIGKFGAVKKMIADMGARRYLIETLDHDLAPADLSEVSVTRAALVKALAAEALGTAPGSISYNAGQVFGGTGYSEDDILSKYYRDAAAWRFLGPENPAAFHAHGNRLRERWREDGDALDALPGEAERFDQLAQRKALQAQLDALRVHRTRVRALVAECRAAGQFGAEDPLTPASAEVGDGLARQDAYLLGSKALLLRTHARLEPGLGSEIEIALLRVWLEAAAGALEEFDGAVRRDLARSTRPQKPSLAEANAGPPVTRYAEFLAAPCPYDSGDFLAKPVDPLQPCYVPEMNETDPHLAAYDRELHDLFTAQFGGPRDGLIYERYLEREHRPDDADLAFLRRHGFFRMPIPKELGGEGRSKVEYYLLTTCAHRVADVAVSLTIQVNSSLGTTPVLVPRDKDLPKARKDIAAFVDDTALQNEVRDQLQHLLALFGPPADGKAIAAAYRELQQKLNEAVLSRPVLRVLGFRFVQAWQEAGKAGLAFDLSTMRTRLADARAAWQEACARAPQVQDEIGRRVRAADLFLRWVAAGQISAFALTEPSAGSDTARVATRARLRSVPVERESDGVLRFVPEGGKEPRYLLDADRLEFRTTKVDGRDEPQAFYRWSDGAEPAPIRFDEYDYETDDPRRMRYYLHGERKVAFTDIAQLRERDGRLWYDYWELTGAKMWITNGRVCGIMALYAKTEEGVTGFIVDRHAEGLVVGKDEAKMGQLGSSTNELSLQQVRVPRENMIGLEGRGQVNALETLNVGRAGLAMSAMAQMVRLARWSRDFARGVSEEPIQSSRAAACGRSAGESSHGTPPVGFSLSPVAPHLAWRLDQIEEDRFISEALAHEIIGRFEHKQTKSIRLEGAVGKMLVSELLHRLIETAEEVHGLAGQTQLHLVEKRKRDARVLNIYEGTNEIQRFFILRDLVSDVANRQSAAAPPTGLGPEARAVEELKVELWRRVREAIEGFGQRLWQDANLQANCFLLAEAVAWVGAAGSTLGRLAFLCRLTQGPATERGGLDDEELAGRIDVGRRALVRCAAEIRGRLRRFDEELLRLRRGLYASSVRAAALLFRRPTPAEPAFRPRSTITRPLSVLVLLDPPAPGSPQPTVADGRLLEPYRILTEPDRAALETALRLRDQAEAPVRVEVATVAPASAGQLLREAVSLGADRVRLVLAPEGGVATDRAAAALAVALGSDNFDLVLCGCGIGSEGLLGRLAAGALGQTFAGSAAQVAVRAGADGDTLLLTDPDGRQQRTRTLPAAVAVAAGVALRAFTVEGYLAGLAHAVEAIPWPAQVEAGSVAFVEAGQAAAASVGKLPQPLLPHEAGQLVADALGFRPTGAALDAETPVPMIEDTGEPSLLRPAASGKPVVLAVLAAEADGRLRPTAARALDAARFVAQFVPGGADTRALLLVPPEEDAQSRAAAELLALSPGDVCLLSAGEANDSAEVRCRVVVECLGGRGSFVSAVVGEPWTEGALATLATERGTVAPAALRVRALDREQGRLLAETPGHGRLRTRQVLALAPGRTCWIGLTAETEVGAVPPVAKGAAPRVERWTPRLERFYGRVDIRRLLEELKHEAGVARLSDAEFIIDVGFGVGNRDGYEAVIDPLERELRALGVRGLMVGGSRKVTEELHLLPMDRQIGQSGVSVNPRILLAIGVSGAPQHLNYIGPRATVVAFNRDPEAPLMTLNQRQARPRVFPVVGDLFETVPAFTARLREEHAGTDGHPAADAARSVGAGGAVG
ncbi:MAG: acyl-CoA dehydrogenase family protein [Gemmataceae bacterium]|nr:acyl-CoA dehydrogenase family protein [Gemmataceae bacterium]